MKHQAYLLILAVLIALPLQAQIKNIEKLRIWSGDRHWSADGRVDLSYNNIDGNYVFQVGTNAGVLYKFRDKNEKFNNKILFHGNFALIRAENENLNNNWFLHLRYNKELTQFFRVEGFVQSQENQLLAISSRNLIGGGIRLKPLQDMRNKKERNLHLYIGLAYMYETERSKNFNVDFYNHRASSYLTAAFKFNDSKLVIINTLYYQPLLKDFDNFRLSEELSIEFPISDTVGFQTSFNYFLNNRTPAGDAEYQSFMGFGFTYEYKSRDLSTD